MNLPIVLKPHAPLAVPFLMCLLVLSASGAAPAQAISNTNATDILAHFPVAIVAHDTPAAGQVPVDGNEYFAGGWYQSGPAESGRVYRWMGPRAGAIDVSMVAPEEITLEIGLVVPRGQGVPPFSVRFYWNGGFIGGAVLGNATQTVKATVPAALTRPGRNRLEIIPSFWVNASRLAGGASDSNVSVNLFQLNVVRSAGAPPRRLPTTPPRMTGAGVEQPPNTVISFFEPVLENARLKVAGHWLAGEGSSDAEAIVVMTTSTGDTHELAKLSRQTPDDEMQEIVLPPLPDNASRWVEFSLVVREAAAAQASTTKFEWTALALTAPEVPVATAPAALPDPSSRPNVILFMIDTLRASYLGPYGATNVSTPNFDVLAARGTTFTAALAHASWTRPSIATLLTSLYETAHGTTTIEQKLAQAVPYLPEILRVNGYRTAAVSMNGHIAPQWGFARGFDSFATIDAQRTELLAPPEPKAYVDKLWDRYVAPGIARDSGPFFLYLHEIDPHGPYTPPAPFDTMYPSHYRGHPEVEADHIALVRNRLTELEPQDIAYLESRYRGEVSFVDALLGALMQRLEREGLADNTVLIVVSDHGEEFGEHGGIGHSVTLYEEMLRVPLFWLWPGRVAADYRLPAPIGLIDLAPTLLSALGIDVPEGMHGRDLSALLGESSSAATEEALLFAYKHDEPGRALQAVHAGPWKLIERMWGAMSSFELFNLKDDPGEVTNRWISEPVVGGGLRQALAWQRHSAGPAARTESVEIEALDPETIEQLRNLGYVH